MEEQEKEEGKVDIITTLKVRMRMIVVIKRGMRLIMMMTRS